MNTVLKIISIALMLEIFALLALGTFWIAPAPIGAYIWINIAKRSK